MPTMLLISDLSNATDFEKYIKAHFIHKRTDVYKRQHNESMYLSAAENKDKYSEARYAGKMDAYRDIFDMMKKLKLE